MFHVKHCIQTKKNIGIKSFLQISKISVKTKHIEQINNSKNIQKNRISSAEVDDVIIALTDEGADDRVWLAIEDIWYFSK